MKTLHTFLTFSLLAAGLQAQAFTKGQQVYPCYNLKERYSATQPDFTKPPFEVIEVREDDLTVYRRDVGAVEVMKDKVFEEKRIVNDWYKNERFADAKIAVKVPALYKGSIVLDGYGEAFTERVVKKVFEAPTKEVGFVFEDGTAGVLKRSFWVVDDPKSGNPAPNGQNGPMTPGRLVVSSSDYSNRTRADILDAQMTDLAPVSKVSAVAYGFSDGELAPLMRVRKGLWTDYDSLYPLMNSAYGLKVGDQVHYQSRFDLRVEQIIKYGYMGQEARYFAILSGGYEIELNSNSAQDLLSFRICKGQGAKDVYLCGEYRSWLESLNNRDKAVCNAGLFPNSDLRIDMRKKTAQASGITGTGFKTLTPDIVEWEMVLPAAKFGQKGAAVKVRLRLDGAKDNSLSYSIEGRDYFMHDGFCGFDTQEQ